MGEATKGLIFALFGSKISLFRPFWVIFGVLGLFWAQNPYFGWFLEVYGESVETPLGQIGEELHFSNCPAYGGGQNEPFWAILGVEGVVFGGFGGGGGHFWGVSGWGGHFWGFWG